MDETGKTSHDFLSILEGGSALRMMYALAKTIDVKESSSLEKSKEIVSSDGTRDIIDLGLHAGEIVKIKCWVSTCRKQGKMIFLIVRDGTHSIQVMLDKHSIAKFPTESEKLRRETAICITGKVYVDDRAPTGYEMHVDTLEIIGEAETIEGINDETSLHVMLDFRHLDHRGSRLTDIMKIRHHFLRYCRKVFEELRYYEVTPPIITAGACEGGSTVFKLKYYDDTENASLSQSSQLYLETMVPSLKRVYCIQPSFRAEKSMTRRHLSEFTHVEAESGFITFDELLNFIEHLVTSVVGYLFTDPEASEIIKRLNPDLKPLKKPFMRMKYSDAIDFLKAHEIYKNDETKEFYVYGDDIPESPERRMVDMIGEPVFMTHFPHEMKSFYMSRDPSDDRETLSVDLLMPGVGEVVGGSMRITDYEKLMDGFKLQKIDPKDYPYYIDQRRYGSVPHGGFGLGTERIIMWLLQQDNVKECCMYPRYVGRCTP
jgi:asparaginyl-tRNA synthetase